jgi:hypothetical protein
MDMEVVIERVEQMVQLAMQCQLVMRRARMESPLTRKHSDRMGEGILAAERIEEIARQIVRRRLPG